MLGGIGPESTAMFYMKVIKAIQSLGISGNHEFPNMIINSIPAPELVNPEVSYDDPGHYAKGLQELDSADLYFILMVCNTIHLFHSRLHDSVNTIIIDLRDVVKRHVRSNGYRRIVVLGTPLTMNSGLYSNGGI